MTDYKTEGWEACASPLLGNSESYYPYESTRQTSGWRQPHPGSISGMDAGPNSTADPAHLKEWGTVVIPPDDHSAGDSAVFTSNTPANHKMSHMNITHQSDDQNWRAVTVNSDAACDSGRTSNSSARDKILPSDGRHRRDELNWQPIPAESSLAGNGDSSTSNTSASHVMCSRWGWASSDKNPWKESTNHMSNHGSFRNNGVAREMHVSSSSNSQSDYLAQRERTQTSDERCAMFLDVGYHW